MTTSALLNLIMSIVTVGMLIAVLRAAHVAAGGRLEEAPKAEVETPYDFERAA